MGIKAKEKSFSTIVSTVQQNNRAEQKSRLEQNNSKRNNHKISKSKTKWLIEKKRKNFIVGQRS